MADFLIIDPSRAPHIYSWFVIFLVGGSSCAGYPGPALWGL